jgi:hypothetical protein
MTTRKPPLRSQIREIVQNEDYTEDEVVDELMVLFRGEQQSREKQLLPGEEAVAKVKQFTDAAGSGCCKCLRPCFSGYQFVKDLMTMGAFIFVMAGFAYVIYKITRFFT